MNCPNCGVALALGEPTLTLVPTVPPPPVVRFGVHVEDTRIIDNQRGVAVQLRGVNRMGGEYACVQGKGLMDGPITQATVDAMKTWGINTLRLPLNEQCWLGVSGTPNGSAYQQGIEDYVKLLTASGIYVILDLQWSSPVVGGAVGMQPLPNTTYSAKFWESVATRFKDNPAVLFDLFNEPVPLGNTDTPAAWAAWRDALQPLLTAVRGTGATNVVIISGLQWANTIWTDAANNWLTFAPVDPLNQRVASLHAYDNTWCRDNTCYEREVAPVALQVPVIFGEFGHRGGDVIWLNNLMTWADTHGVGYLAWAWFPTAGTGFSELELIRSWDGTPSQFGAVVRARLLQRAGL